MKLTMVADFVRHSGFAQVAEAIAAELADRGWQISVLAVNYRGDPTPLQQRYALYPAMVGGDALGMNRIAGVVSATDPDVVLLIADPWIVARYVRTLREALTTLPPMVAYMPVDAPGVLAEACRGVELLHSAVAYTQFGAAELARVGGRNIRVIPHGIDRQVFRPINQLEARLACGVDPAWDVTLVVDRNQPRKAIDLALEGFAAWIHDRQEFGQPTDHLRLVYHGALRDPAGWPLDLLARDLGIAEQFIVTKKDMTALSGVPQEDMPLIYSMADVRLSTTLGEGWGLTLMEAMACGVPVITTHWGAAPEWIGDAAHYLPVVTTSRHREVLTQAGITSPSAIARTLERLQDRRLREHLTRAGLDVVQAPQYHWSAIGTQWHDLLSEVAHA